MLNSPHNPTGAVMPSHTLDELANVIKDNDLLVLSDEVYDRFLFDGTKHQSPATHPDLLERTVMVGSFSKTFAMTGWRVGYACGPETLIKEMSKVMNDYAGCASSVSQRAGLAALQQDSSVVDGMVEEFRLRRDLVYEPLSRLPGVQVHKPVGSFYIFPNIREITEDDEAFALDLLEEEALVTIPGSAFGPSGAGCLRLAFTVDRTLLSEAMARFSRYVEKLAS